MEKMLEILFLVFLFLALYSYAIYPLVLYLFSKVVNHPWEKKSITPSVSIIISVYNEEKVIEEKLKNTLALEYPEDRLEIIVSSDGSTDGTHALVSHCKDSRIVLKVFSGRIGKTACLNQVVPTAKGEIILFTDANSMFPKIMLLQMVKNFSDPSIGLLTGWTKYRNLRGGEETTGIYSRLEMWTKKLESRTSSCVGADGAIFAIRKSLFSGLRDDDINDFVIPLQVIRQRKRVVLDSDIFCFEEASRDSGGEYRRQVRITTRTLGALLRNRQYLNPFQFGTFAFFLLSHKLMRFLVPFFMFFCFVFNMILIGEERFYRVAFGVQLIFVGAGLSSLLITSPGRVIGILKYFFMTSAAQLISWFRVIFGKSDITWTPQR